MELANVQVALGGHKGNTVRVYDATPAEVVVLQRVHGVECVFDIEPTGKTVDRSKREERMRLAEKYGRHEGDRFVSVVLTELYPGSAANIEEQFAELDLPSTAYLAVDRMKPAPIQKGGRGKRSEPIVQDDALFDDGDADMPKAGNALV